MANALPSGTGFMSVRSILGREIRTTAAYFDRIRTIKHPELRDSIRAVLQTFEQPVEVWDVGNDIHLYYQRVGNQWLVAAARHLNGDGFLVTAYRTSKPKRKGIKIWPRRKQKI